MLRKDIMPKILESEYNQTSNYNNMANERSRISSFYNSKLLSTLLFVILIDIVQCTPLTILSYNSVNQKDSSIKLPPLFWNSQNILFSNSVPNFLSINARIGDSIDIICPKNEKDIDENELEYSIIYRVGSKFEFDNCLIDLNNPETIQVFKCDKPKVGPLKYTMFFVKYSPVPFALEFQDDKEYYFISTSSGQKDGLSDKSGGLCSNKNMKFSIKIAQEKTDDYLIDNSITESVQSQEVDYNDNDLLKMILSGSESVKATTKVSKKMSANLNTQSINMKYTISGSTQCNVFSSFYLLALTLLSTIFVLYI